MLHIIQQSCLEKVKPGSRTFRPNFDSASVLIGEEFAYQIVLYTDSDEPEEFHFKGGLGIRPEFYLVKQVPVNWPHYQNDPHPGYLLDEPGLLPDCLVPLGKRRTITVSRYPTVLWVVVRPMGACDFDIDLSFYNDKEEQTTHFYLHIIPAHLPKLRFKYCEYIDPCAVANAHGVPLFSSDHWDLLRKYFEIAANNGVTDLVAPIITPDFDEPTKNPIVQLVRVSSDKPNIYDCTFNFDLLDSWIAIAQSVGIKAITFPPLFPSLKTQRCPYIETKRGFQTVPLFNEDQDIFVHEYTQFIGKLSRALMRHLRSLNLKLRITFQLTNDASAETSLNYRRCREVIQGSIKTVRLMDLNIDYTFFKERLTASQVIPMKNIEPFFEKDSDRLITSFDPRSSDDLINLLIAAPSLRLRSLGTVCYRHDIIGLFNHGFNSGASRVSTADINSYLDTDNENSFPSGTRSLVYPGREAPLASIRLKQIFYGIQDMALFDYAERFTTRRQVLNMVEKETGISIQKYPIDPDRFYALRNRVIALIEERMQNPRYAKYK